MSRLQIIRAVGIVLFCIYIALFVTDIIFDYMGRWQVFVFSLVLALTAINMISKGLFLRSSSTLWFAITLLLCAITILVFDFLGISPSKFYFVFWIIPIIASLINLAIFSNLIYIKVIILNISILIPIITRYFVDLKIGGTWLLTMGSIVLGLVICRSLNLDKEKING